MNRTPGKSNTVDLAAQAAARRTIFVIVGSNDALQNTSARAAYSSREAAEAHLKDEKRMWFDDRAKIVELELDKEVEGR